MILPKRYNIIYIDPPWRYAKKSMQYSTSKSNMAAEKKYGTMSIEDLKKLPIGHLTQDNALIFLWCTVPLIENGFKLLKRWGFTYKTLLVWKKHNGSGYWFRGCLEVLLLAIKGKVKPFRYQKENFYACKGGNHSQKPSYFRTLIEKATKDTFKYTLKLEMFARSRDGMFSNIEYEGWDVYGNEVDDSIDIEKYIW